jgi:riboflavin kinase / FMN adenylyltransferase
MPPVLSGGEVVSSTRIRHLVKAGDMRGATRCLGRPYAFYGKVIKGAQRGQGLGWPTANLRLPEGRVLPPDGVYAATVVWKGRRFPSVAYIGTRPTFDAGERLLEVYLLDQQMDLYEEEIGVEAIERIRDDARFDSAEELSARIDLDVRQARKALAEEPQTVSNG